MKKKYIQPTTTVVELQQESMICGSDVTSTSNDADLNEEILAGDGTARSRQYGLYDDVDIWDE